MDHYLFTDGTSEVKEAHSEDELLSLVNSCASPGMIRVWEFNTNEWLDYTAYLKQNPGFGKSGAVKPLNGTAAFLVSP